MQEEAVPSARAELTSRLSLILEAAPQGVVVVNDAGKILLVNAELERMFGYPRSQLLNQPVECLLPERYRTAHVAMRMRYHAEPVPRAMGAQRELFGLRADGVEFPVEIGVNAVRTDDGWASIAAVTDISARKQAEAALRNVVDAAPYGLIVLDAEGTIMMANARLCAAFGYTQDALLGRSLELLLPERYRASHPALRHGYTARPELRAMGSGRDLTGRHADGSEIAVEVGLSPVEWNGKPMVLAAVIDITKRKAMEIELRQLNAHLEEFTYVASHDLKSPLRGINDLVQWIEEDLGTQVQPEVQKNLRRVQARVERMERIIEDLLAYARAGSTSADLSVVDPKALLESITELLPRPAGFDLKLSVNAEPFKAERTPLETCLRNLIDNAIKHHDRERAEIQIEAFEADSYCCFQIRDDGPGIPQRSQSRVFNLFQTVSAAERGGSGVGLALAKRLVECHGGKIRLESVDGQRGTLFEVLWPRFQRRSAHDQL